MAKKAPMNDKAKSRKEPRKRHWLLRLLMSRPVRWLVLVVVVLALLWWQWPNLVRLLGWGLVFIAAAIITLVVQIRRHKASSFLFHWNRWLGAVAFVLAIWGILAFFRLGGNFGLSIITAPRLCRGALRILGLVIIGIVLEAPRECWRLLLRFFAWLGERFKKKPGPGQSPVRRVIHPPTPLEERVRNVITRGSGFPGGAGGSGGKSRGPEAGSRPAQAGLAAGSRGCLEEIRAIAGAGDHRRLAAAAY